MDRGDDDGRDRRRQGLAVVARHPHVGTEQGPAAVAPRTTTAAGGPARAPLRPTADRRRPRLARALVQATLARCRRTPFEVLDHVGHEDRGAVDSRLRERTVEHARPAGPMNGERHGPPGRPAARRQGRGAPWAGPHRTPSGWLARTADRLRSGEPPARSHRVRHGRTGLRRVLPEAARSDRSSPAIRPWSRCSFGGHRTGYPHPLARLWDGDGGRKPDARPALDRPRDIAGASQPVDKSFMDAHCAHIAKPHTDRFNPSSACWRTS